MIRNDINISKVNNNFFSSSIMTLNELQAGEMGVVLSIKKDLPDYLRAITEMGIRPHCWLRMASHHSHNLIINLSGKNIAMDQVVASQIVVQTI